MRANYHEELDGLLDSLQDMAVLVETAVSEASAALLNPDLARAEAVITNDAELDAIHEDLEYRCLSLLALQAPVAGELRTIVSAIRVVFELARMGDLAAHVAKIARLRFPDSAVPENLRANFARMSEVCLDMIRLAHQSLKNRDAEAALRMAEIDHEMDGLRRDHFGVLLGEHWSGSVEQAIDVALLGRYYERFADHAVAVARRVIYIITGGFPEGEEWPNA
ncbi:MAG: phosphate signaling complex protein PhoU [Propionibacteriaceae bacterium]|nr:phosphate signaling complex protein PhoU [Propionibacteriaceae bacterium]